MKKGALDYLVCPICQSELQADLCAPAPDGEYMSGSLRCCPCSHAYPIVDGVPRMVVATQEPRGAAETFGFEWRKHGEKDMEGDTVFGRTQQEDLSYFLEATHMSPEEVNGAVILDAGCGSGQLTEGIGDMQARAVFGIDVNTAIDFPFRRCRRLPNVHIVQADISALPFRAGQFDLAWSNGVIHHTPNPPQVFASLASRVSTRGRLYIWVYERRWSAFTIVGKLLRAFGVQRRLSLQSLRRLSRLLAVASFAGHSVYRAVRWLPPLRPASFATSKTTRFRSLGAFDLTWFDILSPKYDAGSTRSQVAEWFKDQGFGELVFYPDQIGICGIKQDGPTAAHGDIAGTGGWQQQPAGAS
jgi:SAM-dependent methyltransferase/uncharacterized protein YbaR (Trm112 family)